MNPTDFAAAGLTPTGKKPAVSHYYKGVLIIALDEFQRLPFNFAVSHSRYGYREFRCLKTAKRFVREVTA